MNPCNVAIFDLFLFGGVNLDLNVNFKNLPENPDPKKCRFDYTKLFIAQRVVSGGPFVDQCYVALSNLIGVKVANNKLQFVPARTNTSIAIEVSISSDPENDSKPYLSILRDAAGFSIIGIDDIRGYKLANPFFQLDLEEGINIRFANNKLMLEGGVAI